MCQLLGHNTPPLLCSMGEKKKDAESREEQALSVEQKKKDGGMWQSLSQIYCMQQERPESWPCKPKEGGFPYSRPHLSKPPPVPFKSIDTANQSGGKTNHLPSLARLRTLIQGSFVPSFLSFLTLCLGDTTSLARKVGIMLQWQKWRVSDKKTFEDHDANKCDLDGQVSLSHPQVSTRLQS